MRSPPIALGPRDYNVAWWLVQIVIACGLSFCAGAGPIQPVPQIAFLLLSLAISVSFLSSILTSR
jgi:hypothetical protein